MTRVSHQEEQVYILNKIVTIQLAHVDRAYLEYCYIVTLPCIVDLPSSTMMETILMVNAEMCII